MADKRRTPARGAASRPGARGRSGPGRPAGGPRTRAPLAGRAPDGPGPSVRRPRLTGRAMILVLVLAVLAVSYASSARAYLQQRAHLDDLRTEIAERQADIDVLEREQRRWEDPAYVEQVARERFGYVMPGERSFVVLDEDGEPLEAEATLTDPADVAPEEPTAWWDEAWASVETAGRPPKDEGTPPATEIDGSPEQAPSGQEDSDQ
ncbi:MAG: septum formation initiator family protein [Nocardioides sp.]|nr:hypothetical protein ASF50_13690 [Nocardioides sp. Leaf307]MBJ7528762.1 septum formation initiator family protein [Nocardioides sp.]